MENRVKVYELQRGDVILIDDEEHEIITFSHNKGNHTIYLETDLFFSKECSPFETMIKVFK